jgi:hypothetical protein
MNLFTYWKEQEEFTGSTSNTADSKAWPELANEKERRIKLSGRESADRVDEM